MAITAAVLSIENTRLTLTYSPALSTGSTPSLTLGGYNALGVNPTLLGFTDTSATYEIPDGQLWGSQLTAVDTTNAPSSTPVTVTGFELDLTEGYINSSLINFETFPLELEADKEDIELSVSRSTVSGSNAKGWVLSGLTLFSTTEIQKRYLTKYLPSRIYRDAIFELTPPTEYHTPSTSNIAITVDTAANAGANTISVDTAGGTLNSAVSVGTFINIGNSTRVFSVTEVLGDNISFTPSLPQSVIVGERVSLNPTFRVRVSSNRLTYETPPGVNANGEPINNFTRITLDLEEV